MQKTTENFSQTTSQELLELEQIVANLTGAENLKDILIRVTALQRQVFAELDRRKQQTAGNA